MPWRFIFLGLGLMAFCTMLLMAVSLPKTTGLQRHMSMRHELSLLRDRRIWHGAVFVCFNAASSYCWYSYVAPMLTDVMGFGTAWVSPVLLMLGMGTIFSTLAGGKIAEQGGIYILWPVVAVHAALTLLLLLSAYSAAGLAVLLMLSMFFYVQCASAQMYFMRISLLFHPGTTLMASSISPTFFNLGVALGSAIGSATVDVAGVALTPLPGSICMALSAFFIWYAMLPERRRKHALQGHA